jgi:hypothetical protein
MLIRYWFKTDIGFGYGVTAFSQSDAESLLASFVERIGKDRKVVEIVPNIDIRTLDQNHVIPNMGPSNIRGVWYPSLNL